MKFSAVFGVLALAGAVMAQSTTTGASAPANTDVVTTYGKLVDDCLKVCKDGDVACQALCLSNPNPSEDMANSTTECAAKCEQGDGTEAQTAKYAACQQACIKKHFLPTEGPGSAKPSGSAGSNGGNGSSDDSEDGDDKKADSKDGEDKKDEENKDSAAGSNTIMVSFVGAAAMLAAAFAL